MKITNKFGPNTTVLLPGSCNAHCEFCFWNRDESLIRAPDNYVEKVLNQIGDLPELFSVLSVSGGEPTLSPFFSKFVIGLSYLRRYRHFDRCVLTTHGGNLDRYITAVGCAFDHINISRHGIGNEENFAIFGTDRIPTDRDLAQMIARIHAETHCDVTLNCVIPDDRDHSNHDVRDFCMSYIEHAKKLGADAVSFRKVASDVKPTRAEKAFAKRFGVESRTNCPVCRGMNQRVEGFDVRWKGSVAEPSIETHGVYELVYHPDGNAYADWGMKHKLEAEAIAKAYIPSDTDEDDGDSDNFVEAVPVVHNPIRAKLDKKKARRKVVVVDDEIEAAAQGRLARGSCGSSSGGASCGHRSDVAFVAGKITKNRIRPSTTTGCGSSHTGCGSGGGHGCGGSGNRC